MGKRSEEKAQTDFPPDLPPPCSAGYPCEIGLLRKLADDHTELADGAGHLLHKLADDNTELADELINSLPCMQNRAKEMPYFGQEIFTMAEKKADLNDRAYRLALQKSKLLTQAQGIDAVMNKNKLDAFIAPSGGVAWMTDLVNGDCGVFEGMTSIAAVAGYPSITVPAGFVQELPVGMSFFGRAFAEPTLIKIAYAFEQATKARRAPKFLPIYA